VARWLHRRGPRQVKHRHIRPPYRLQHRHHLSTPCMPHHPLLPSFLIEVFLILVLFVINRAFAGQLNHFTQLRALLLLKDRVNVVPKQNCNHTTYL
jgi:hypothetical protein